MIVQMSSAKRHDRATKSTSSSAKPESSASATRARAHNNSKGLPVLCSSSSDEGTSQRPHTVPGSVSSCGFPARARPCSQPLLALLRVFLRSCLVLTSFVSWRRSSAPWRHLVTHGIHSLLVPSPGFTVPGLVQSSRACALALGRALPCPSALRLDVSRSLLCDGRSPTGLAVKCCPQAPPELQLAGLCSRAPGASSVRELPARVRGAPASFAPTRRPAGLSGST